MRKMKEVKRFARWCFAQCGVKPCKIHYAPATYLITDERDRDGNCFGCYWWDDEKHEPGEIYVACNLSKWPVLSVIAHEIVHHKQHMERNLNLLDEAECEEEAERIGSELLGRWVLRGGKIDLTEVDDE